MTRIRARRARTTLNRVLVDTAEIELMGTIFSSEPTGMIPRKTFGTLYTKRELEHIIRPLR